MTDNRTTELLRLLEDRGARYGKPEDDTTIYYDGDGNRYTYNVNPDSGWAQLFGYNLTPEQAIAATLGNDASAVRLAEKLRGIADEMRNVGASSMKPHELLSCYAAEVDKVADLLKFAATLGGGKCEMAFGDDMLPECGNCGEPLNYYTKRHGMRDRDRRSAKFCPQCGKAVKR